MQKFIASLQELPIPQQINALAGRIQQIEIYMISSKSEEGLEENFSTPIKQMMFHYKVYVVFVVL